MPSYEILSSSISNAPIREHCSAHLAYATGDHSASIFWTQKMGAQIA
jgi:hypothetical protein